MATLTIVIDRRRKPYTVSFQFRHGRTRKRFSAGISLEPSEVSASGKRIKNLGKAMLIEGKRRELQDKLDSIMVDYTGREVTGDEVLRRLLAEQNAPDFYVFAEGWLARTTIRGKVNYECMLKALRRYSGREKLPFGDITFKFLTGFEAFLAGKPRAQSLYLGELRHLYREAMRELNDDDTQVIKNDPFLRYRVPRQVLRKGVRALTLEQLLLICCYKGEEGSRAQLARDCFILSFALMGMNSVDMYEVDTMRGDRICYRRAKTRGRRSDGAYIEVCVHPMLRGLMEKYKGSERVFCFAERYANRIGFNRNLNLGLKEVGKAVGIEGLQFYQARHTFATLERNLMHVAKSDVDEALNHVGGMELADVYIKKDFTIINENLFALIERVFGDKGVE